MTAPGASSSSHAIRWVVAALAAACLIAMLAYACGNPGDDGRDPGPDEGAFAPAMVIGG